MEDFRFIHRKSIFQFRLFSSGMKTKKDVFLKNGKGMIIFVFQQFSNLTFVFISSLEGPLQPSCSLPDTKIRQQFHGKCELCFKLLFHATTLANYDIIKV